MALVHAWQADTAGNLLYRFAARNFNPIIATAGKVTFAEAEHIVGTGEMHPDQVVTPGVYVQHVIRYSGALKEIEQRTVRPRPVQTSAHDEGDLV